MRRGTVLLLTAAAVSALSVVWATMRPQPAQPLPALTVEVLNGCGEDQLAARAATALRGLGQDVVAVGDAGHHEHARSVLVDRRGKPTLTRRLAARLNGALVVLDRVDDAPADVTLILGQDYRQLGLLE